MTGLTVVEAVILAVPSIGTTWTEAVTLPPDATVLVVLLPGKSEDVETKLYPSGELLVMPAVSTL